ncbi:MAG: cytochrome C [Epsilonproteobacteria bacterium (ex Lamellibrachia satsuma)]|nr:MAG: cytochrome C [Epsilonproteobacteria bacterium (ex Lamellibrachia satsuma)]
MKQLLLLFTFSLILFASTDAETLYLKNACNSCHGMYAEGMGTAPRLQGQKETVLFRRLKDLQQGKTRTAFGSVMISFAKALDEDQIIAMAKYLSTLKTTVNEERYESEYDPAGDGGS